MVKTSLFLLGCIIIFIFLSGCYYFLAERPAIEKTEYRAKRYVAKHPELDERIKNSILDNKIDVGMTKEQVKLIIGYRWPKIRKTDKYEADEVWIYRELWVDEVLYFKGNVLIKIETVPRQKS